MKRFFSLLLVFGMVFALVGCQPKATLSIEDKTVTLTVGQTETIVPTVTGNKKVVWLSSNPSVATVSNTGVITAVDAGTAKVTVSLDGTNLSQEITVTVVRPDPTSVKVTGAGDVLIEDTLQLTGTVTPATAQQTLTWTSENPEVATVDANGLVTGVAVGETKITATSSVSTIKDEVKVKVVRPNPTAVTITGPNEVLLLNSITLTATVAPDLAAQGVLWSVDDLTIATITADGVLTGIKGGTVVVKAVSPTKVTVYGEYTVTVTLPDPTEITVSGPAALPLDMEGTYTAVVAPSDAAQTVVWSVSDTAVATITAEGVLKPVAEGTVKVIATSTALDTIKEEFEVTIEPERIHVGMNLDGAYWPITGTDAFIDGKPVASLETKAGLNPSSADYLSDDNGYKDHIFIQDKNYKISPSVWQNRAFLNRNANGFFEVKKVVVAGGSNANPTLADYEYVIYAHSGHAAGYKFIAGLEEGQIITLNGFDINAIAQYDIGDITVNIYTKEQAVSTAGLLAPGGQELTLPVPGKLGYLFDGWYTKADFSGDPITKLSESTDIYAKWKIDYTVILVNNDTTIADGTIFYSENAKKHFIKGSTAFDSLAEAIAKVEADGVIYVEAGEYDAAATVNKNGLSILGFEGAVIKGKISVDANIDGLTIKGLKFSGDANIELALAGGIENFTFENNIATDPTIGNNTFISFKNDGTAINKDFVFKGNKFLMGESKSVPRWIRGGNIENFTVVNNIFEGITGEYVDGIRIEGTNETNSDGIGVGGVVTITNNQFNKVGQRGLWFRRISATKFDFNNNILDQTGGPTAGGGLQIEVLVPDTVLEVNILKNTFKNITHFFGIRIGTATTPTLGTVNIKENKFINFTLETAKYIQGYEGLANIDANVNYYQVLPEAASMPNLPVDSYAEAFDKLKVTFKPQGGPEVAAYEVPVALERKAVKPEDPVRVGYTFGGWFKEEACKNAFNFETETVNFPINLYAKWTAIEYNINYNIDGGEFGLAFANKADMLVAFMDDLYAFINPTESKSDFLHGEGKTSGYDGLWHSKEEYKSKIYAGPRPEAPNNDYFISHEDYMEKWLPFFDNMEAFVVAVNNTQHFYNSLSTGLIRIKQYIINTKPAPYITDETMAMIPTQYKLSVKYNIENEYPLVAPTKAGRIFVGWFDNAEFTGEPVTKIEKGTIGDLEFYAKWIYSVTVAYKNVDESTIAIQQLVKGSIHEQPADPVRTGYNFVAWFTTAELKDEYEFNQNLTKDVTIYAKWEEIVYDLAFELNGGQWSWDVAEVTAPGGGINAVSTLPIIFMQDFYDYLKKNDLLKSEQVATELQKTNWVDFSKNYNDPVAIYNWCSAGKDGGAYTEHTGYSQFFYETAAGNDETREITEIVGGFFGTEPYKSKYANLASHLALMLPEKYSKLKFWGGADDKGGMGFTMDGYFYGTQGAGDGKFLALRSVIPTTNTKYVFDGDGVKAVETVYQVLTNKFTAEAKIMMPSRVGYVFEGWYTNAAFTGNKVDTIGANKVPAAKYYAKWKDIRYDEVDINFELNGGLRTTYIEATRYHTTTSWIPGAQIVVNTNFRAYWYNVALKETDVSGVYESLGKVTKAHAEADLYIMVHDDSTSTYKATAIKAITGSKAGDTIIIKNIPAAATTTANIDIFFVDTSAVKMFLPGDFPTVTRDGYTFEGWYDNAEFNGDPVASYPGFEGVDIGTITYYAKWKSLTSESLIATYDFGTVAKTGYAAGNLTWKNVDDTEVTVVKDRVQVNTSTYAPHDTMGALMVFAPISTTATSFADFDLSALTDLKRLELQYCSWSGTAQTNIAALTAANFSLQKKDGEAWVNVKTIDLKTISATEYATVSFDVTGAGIYRLTYVVDGATSTKNTDYALTVDNIKLFR